MQVNPATAALAPPPIAPPAAAPQPETASAAGSQTFTLPLSKPGEAAATADASQEFTLSLSNSNQTAAAPAGAGAPRSRCHRGSRGAERSGRLAAQLHRDGCRFRHARAASAELGRQQAGGRRCSRGPSGRPARGGTRHRAHDGAHRRRQGRGHGRGREPNPDRCELPDRPPPGAGMAGPAAQLRAARRDPPLARASRGQCAPGCSAGAEPRRRAERAAAGLCGPKPGLAGGHRRRAALR